jgi:membrane protein
MNTLIRRGAKLSERAQTHIAELLLTLRTWPWFDTLRTLRDRFREDRLGLTAGSLTFTTLIALVPLVTVMLAVFTVFPMFSGFEAALQKYFLQNLVPDSIAKPVLRSLTQFAGKARGIGTLGLLLLVATALALALTIDRTLNAIWRVRTPRPLAQRILIYWTGLTLGPLALGVSLSLTSYAVSASKGLVSALPGGLGILLDPVQFILFAAATAGLFHFVPNTAVRWRHAWAGGLFVAVAFEIAKKGLAWYVAAVPTFSAVYGAFATVPILLLWIYLGWVIMLLGAVIAAYAPSLQMRVTRRAATPGWRFELALAVLQRLAVARQGQQHGLSLAALAHALRVDPLQLEPVMELLVDIDWVQHLDEPADSDNTPPATPRCVLLCDPATTPISALLDRTLLQPGEASASFRQAVAWSDLMLQQALSGPAPRY